MKSEEKVKRVYPEALMVIASAWSFAFIVLFFGAVITLPQLPRSPEESRVISFLLVGAVTGFGWLWFRSELKERLNIEAYRKAHGALGGEGGENMISRPPIREIVYVSPEGNPHRFTVSLNCTEIREIEENGELAFIPWVEVWDGEKLLFRASQHKLEHIFY